MMNSYQNDEFLSAGWQPDEERPKTKLHLISEKYSKVIYKCILLSIKSIIKVYKFTILGR